MEAAVRQPSPRPRNQQSVYHRVRSVLCPSSAGCLLDLLFWDSPTALTVAPAIPGQERSRHAVRVEPLAEFPKTKAPIQRPSVSPREKEVHWFLKFPCGAETSQINDAPLQCKRGEKPGFPVVTCHRVWENSARVRPGL